MDKIEIIQEKISPKHNDCLFYNGEIAKIGKYTLTACGDIRIHKNGELIYDGKERDGGFGFDMENDDDLSKVSEENGFSYENNNWFEVYNNETGEDILGDVAYDYDEGIKLLKQYYKEKIYD